MIAQNLFFFLFHQEAPTVSTRTTRTRARAEKIEPEEKPVTKTRGRAPAKPKDPSPAPEPAKRSNRGLYSFSHLRSVTFFIYQQPPRRDQKRLHQLKKVQSPSITLSQKLHLSLNHRLNLLPLQNGVVMQRKFPKRSRSPRTSRNLNR